MGLQLPTWNNSIIFLVVLFVHMCKCEDSCLPKCVCETTETGDIVANCRGAQLTEVPKPVKSSHISVLDLQFNRIERIREGDFSRYKNLTELSLEGNRISAIEEGGFQGLRGLRKLDLSKNMLRDLPDTEVNRLSRKLEWLSVAMNALLKIPAVFQQQKLKHFNVSNNRFITELPGGSLPKSLMELDLQYCGIKLFRNSSFRNLHSLRTLFLNDNMASGSLVFEEGVFDHLTRLEFLDLSRSYCKKLPRMSFRNLQKLKTLLMNNCWLSESPILSFNNDNESQTSEDKSVSGYLTRKNGSFGYSKLSSQSRTWYNPRLKVLDLSNNRRMKIKLGQIHFPRSLKELHLGKTNIPDIDNNMFKNLAKLTKLDICSSKVRVIESRAFIRLRNISEICVSGNPFEITPSFPPSLTELHVTDTKIVNLTKASLSGLKHVVRLNMQRNNIQDIENMALQDMVALKELDLSHNELSILKKNSLSVGPDNKSESRLFGEVQSSLLMLNLSFNDITEIAGGAFFSHKRLLTLDLRGNMLDSIQPETFQGLEDISTLMLSHNVINYIAPGSFKRMTKLQVLHLGENELALVGDGMFSGLNALTELYLGYNTIVAISGMTLRSLQILDISFNDLESLPSLAGKQLKEIRASYNLMKSFDSGTLKQVPGLKILDLSYCSIQTIDYEAFQDTPGLVELYLTGNHIGIFPDTVIPNLKSLGIGENEISSIDNYISDFLPAIQHLDLGYNNLTAIHPSIFYGASSLQSIDLSGNNFNCDCSLLPLAEWIEDNLDIVEELEFYLCNEPSDAYTVPILDYLLQDIYCEDFDSAFKHKEVIIIGLSIVLAFVSLLLLVLLLMLMLHRKSKSRRRENACASTEEDDVIGIVPKLVCCTPTHGCHLGRNEYQRGRKESDESVSSWERKAITSSTPATSTVESDTQG